MSHVSDKLPINGQGRNGKMLMEHTKLDEYFFAMIYSPLFGGHGMRTIVLRGKHQQPRSSLSCWQPGNWPGWRRRRRRRRGERGAGKDVNNSQRMQLLFMPPLLQAWLKAMGGRKKEIDKSCQKL